MREFGVETQHTHNQKKEEHIRLDNACEKFLPPGQLERRQHGIRERQPDLRAIEPSNLTSVELLQKIVYRCRQEIDQLAVQSFLFGESPGIGDRGFCQGRVSPPFVRKTAEKRGGVVRDFSAQRVVN